MNLQASKTIPRRPKDGETGDGIVNTVISYAKSESGTTPPSTGWASTLPTPTQGWYLWTRTVTTYRIKPATTTYSVSSYGKDGEPGGNGLPGQTPIQKEWVVGDTHRNTDDIVDYIYVRGADKNTSYWYKLASKGTVTAGAPPTGGTTPSGYERIDWLKELAVKVLLAEEANLANFIFRNGRLESIFRDALGAPNLVLDGKSGNIDAKSGTIGGMRIEGDKLVSQNGRVVVDGANNAIYLLDENGSTKTVLRPDNIPSISSYFADSFNKTVDTTPITGGYTESYNQKQTVSFNLPTGSFEAIIPEMTLHVYTTSTSELGGGTSLRVELVSPSGVYAIGSVSAWASGQFGSDDQSITIPRRTFPISGSGACFLRIRLQNDSIGGSHATGTGSVLVSSNMVVNGVVNRSEIGNNGMMIATTRTSYNYMVGDTFEIRRGQNIFRLNEAGIKINKNGGTGTWTDV